MNFRLWFPQLDVYDAIRRMSALLNSWSGVAASAERLYIIDFYFANPPLLHKTNMPSHVRSAFNALNVNRPEQSFISYPSPPLLFHKMESVQQEALRTLTGKGLVNRKALVKGTLVPSDIGKKFFRKIESELVSSDEQPILQFLLMHLAHVDEGDIDALRRRTGLRRATS